jgi:hypothetical protein
MDVRGSGERKLLDQGMGVKLRNYYCIGTPDR